MPNIKSAKKRVLVIEKKTLENKRVVSRMKTAIKKFNIALAANDFDKAVAMIPETSSIIDSAATNGVIHKNNAARKKAQLYLNVERAKVRRAHELEIKKAQEAEAAAKAKEAEIVEVKEQAPAKKTTKKAAAKAEEVTTEEKKPAAKKTAAKKAETTEVAEKKPAAKKAEKTGAETAEKKPAAKKTATKKDAE